MMNQSGRATLEPAQLSEVRYRRILEQASDAIFVIAPDGRIVVANPAAAAMLGYTQEDLLRLRLADFVSRDDLASPEARMSALEAGGRLLSERTLIRKDGTRLVAEISTTMLPDGSIQGIARDVTARRRGMERVRDSERRLRAIFRAIPVPTYAWERLGDDFVLVDCNDAARKLTDNRIQYLLGRTASDFFVATPDIVEHIRTCANEQRVVRVEMAYTLVTTGVPRRFVVTYAPVADDLVLVHTVDVTEQRAAEDELRRRESELRQIQKLEALGRLAGGVAHDFNNLLTIITTSIEFLRQRLPEGSNERADADDVREAALRAAELTRQLMAFGRRQVLECRPLDMNQIVLGIEPLARRLLGRDVRLEVMTADVGAVHGDRAQLEQVIMNLMVNANDAMPDGGTVRMRTATRKLTRSDATGPRQAGDYVVLTVEDTGAGMDDATRTRIFEPFFTTKADAGGTGLGLATVHGIVKQSGGFITVDSAPGAGSAFHVHLPVWSAESAGHA